jgi:hypothetical protein
VRTLGFTTCRILDNASLNRSVLGKDDWKLLQTPRRHEYLENRLLVFLLRREI